MTEAVPEADPLVGQLLTGRYRVVERIGEGGMGTVYRARHEAIEKEIALKVLHREYSSNADVVKRFKQEAISASRIKHPNVIDVFDFGQLEEGSCFIAMEFLEGRDLGDALENVGAFDPEEALHIILQVCRALGTAHARGVVHRDLKPENIFLQRAPEGEQVVKIVDFGIAQLRSDEPDSIEHHRQRRLTKTGMIFGTPEYMAPEQARGKDVDARADVYATGCILYELLSGGVPFAGDSFLDVLNKHCVAEVPPMDQLNPQVRVSQELQTVVLKSLEKRPEDRFETMKQMAHALLRTPEGRAVRASISSISALGEFDAEPPDVPGATRGQGPTTAIIGSGREPVAGPASAPVEDDAPELPTRSSKGLWVGVLALIAAVGAAAAFMAPGWQQETQVGKTAGDQRDASAESKADPTPPPSPELHAPEGSDPAAQAPEEVVVRVVTDPEGAIVEKDGFQVCDSTPCDVSLDLDEAVTLTAKKAQMTGEAKVLAQREQTVNIPLRAPRVNRPSPAPAPAPAPQPAQPAMCEVVVDGLKILRPCK